MPRTGSISISHGHLDGGKRDEVAHVVAIRPPGVLVVEVGEPLRFGRHVRQPMELRAGQESTFN